MLRIWLQRSPHVSSNCAVYSTKSDPNNSIVLNHWSPLDKADFYLGREVCALNGLTATLLFLYSELSPGIIVHFLSSTENRTLQFANTATAPSHIVAESREIFPSFLPSRSLNSRFVYSVFESLSDYQLQHTKGPGYHMSQEALVFGRATA